MLRKTIQKFNKSFSTLVIADHSNNKINPSTYKILNGASHLKNEV